MIITICMRLCVSLDVVTWSSIYVSKSVMSDNEDKKDIQVLSEKVHIGIDVSGMQ